jgi:hypothetical protein
LQRLLRLFVGGARAVVVLALEEGVAFLRTRRRGRVVVGRPLERAARLRLLLEVDQPVDELLRLVTGTRELGQLEGRGARDLERSCGLRGRSRRRRRRLRRRQSAREIDEHDAGGEQYERAGRRELEAHAPGRRLRRDRDDAVVRAPEARAHERDLLEARSAGGLEIGHIGRHRRDGGGERLPQPRGDLLHTGRTVRAIPREQVGDELRELRGHARTFGDRRSACGDALGRCIGRERSRARRELVKHGAERVEIVGGRGRLAGVLLRTHRGRRAARAQREAVGTARRRDAEVREPRLTRAVHEHVGELEVPVDDTLGVRVRERVDDRQQHGQELDRRPARVAPQIAASASSKTMNRGSDSGWKSSACTTCG